MATESELAEIMEKAGGKEVGDKKIRSRGWVLTWNWKDGDEDENGQIKKPFRAARIIDYLVYVHQKGKKTGHDHWQIYLQAKKPQCKEKIIELTKKVWKTTQEVYVGAQRGTAMQARKYIMEDSKETNQSPPVESGDFDPQLPPVGVGQGERKDLAEMKELIDKGVPTKTLWKSHFGTMAKSYKAMKIYESIVRSELKAPVMEEKLDKEKLAKLINYVNAPNPDGRTILWWVAPVGTGKTTVMNAFENYLKENNRSFYQCGGDVNASRAANKWEGEPILMCDLPKETIQQEVPYKFFEGILDGKFHIGFGVNARMEYCVETGKRMRGWVIVTSNLEPDQSRLDKTYVML